jgi:hypothetical protein
MPNNGQTLREVFRWIHVKHAVAGLVQNEGQLLKVWTRREQRGYGMQTNLTTVLDVYFGHLFAALSDCHQKFVSYIHTSLCCPVIRIGDNLEGLKGMVGSNEGNEQALVGDVLRLNGRTKSD